MMKRVLSIVLVLAMLFCDIPASALYRDAETPDAPVVTVTPEEVPTDTKSTPGSDNGEEHVPLDGGSTTPAAEEQTPANEGQPSEDSTEPKTGETEPSADTGEETAENETEEVEEEPTPVSLTVSGPADPSVNSSGHVRFSVTATLTPEGSATVSYTWQFCRTSDDAEKVAKDPDDYSWKPIDDLPDSIGYVSGGNDELKLSGEPEDFDGYFFRCIVRAGELEKSSRIASVKLPATMNAMSDPNIVGGDENCEHNWLPGQYHEATCDEGGFNADTCSICEAYKSDTKSYDGTPTHPTLNWGDTRMSCTEGKVWVMCAVCGEYALRDDANYNGTGNHVYEDGRCVVCNAEETHTEHQWDEGTVTTEPTCGDTGVRTYHCTVEGCTATKTEIIGSTGEHIWGEATTVEPTCTTDGYDISICSVCNQPKMEHFTHALGHAWSVWTRTVEPACEAEGEDQRTCDTCHETETRTVEALGHDWDEGEVTTPATCTADGVMTHTCLRDDCDATKTEPIPATGHTLGEPKEVVPPTCRQDGHEKYDCTVCGEEVITVQPLDPDAHNWNETEDPAATCVAPGILKRNCTNEGCDAHEELDIPIDPEAHDWNEGEVTTPATCTADGVMTFTCLREECGATKTEPIPATGHDFIDHVCSVCHESYPATEAVRAAIDALPAIAAVTVQNADAILEDIREIDAMIDALTEEEAAALQEVYPDRVAKLNDLRAYCNALLSTTEYVPTPGERNFTLFWNDDNSGDLSLHTPAEEFLDATDAYLTYTIRATDGSEAIVSSGTLPRTDAAEAAKAAFGYFCPEDYVFPATTLSCTAENAGAYIIKTDPALPVSYKAIYTDYQTLETVEATFNIEYFLHIKNPVADNYLYTDSTTPLTDGYVGVVAGNRAILTKLLDWQASVSWRDDNNRSASSGATDAADSPRIDETAFRNNTKIYRYSSTGSHSSAEEVTSGDFAIEQNSNSWTLGLSGLPAYNNSGSLFNYYIKHTDSTIPAANGSGDYYAPAYLNVGNFGSRTDSLYNGGELTEYLSNEVPFTVTKIWADRNSSSRPTTATLHVWRASETYDASGKITVSSTDGFPVPGTQSSYSVGTAENESVIYLGVDESTTFPKYDTFGRRYIYFGVEKGLTGGYELSVDNDSDDSRSRNKPNIIADISTTHYFINGATLTNALDPTAKPSFTKNFEALSLQNFPGLTATFLLQRRQGDEPWENATADDILSDSSSVSIAESGITYTLTGFNAESLTDSASPVTLRRYDEEYNVIDYRWIEIGISANGSSAAVPASSWDENGAYIGRSVSLTEGGSQSGPENTTIRFTPSRNSKGETVNRLIGTSQVQVVKYWFDRQGNSIADPSKVTDPSLDLTGVQVRFRIIRSDGVTTENGQLTDIDGNPVTDLFLGVEDLAADVPAGETDYWTRLLNLPHYDEDGREYSYTVSELNLEGTSEIGWMKDQHYQMETIWDEERQAWENRTISIHTNRMGDGGSILTFDITKEWQDDSDLATRHPVKVSIYRFRNAKGDLLENPVRVTGDITLSAANNWYTLKKIAGVDYIDEETGARTADTVMNYIVWEEGIVIGDATVPMHIAAGESMDTLFDKISATPFTDVFIGIVGDENDIKENWDGLDYRYNVTVGINDVKTALAFNPENPQMPFTNSTASYTITNTRIGQQKIVMQKDWKAGGIIKGSVFGLFNGETQIATFTVKKESYSDGSTAFEFIDTDPSYYSFVGESSSDYSSVKMPVFIVANSGLNGNHGFKLTIDGLPKFNKHGSQNNMSIREIKIINEAGVAIPVVENHAVVDDLDYYVSSATNIEYKPNDEHRSGDVYNVNIVNYRQGSYPLISAKVWRDDKQFTRPDVNFSVRRISARGELLDLVNAANNADGILAYIKDNLSHSEIVYTDCYWDTRVNDFQFVCRTDPVAQFDADGYPYVYFGMENQHGGAVTYQGYYSNRTWAQDGADYRGTFSPDVHTTQEAYSQQNYLIPAEGNYFIMADGVNKGYTNQLYQNFYSATVVNRPEMSRTINGNKLWKLPLGWTIPQGDFPAINVNLYRSTERVEPDQYIGDAKAYADKVIEVAEVIDETTGSKILGTTTTSFETNFSFEFPLQGEAELPFFDKWGAVYEYYVLEEFGSTLIPNFPYQEIRYEGENFNITNVFSPRPPYVEITVRKTWDISDLAIYADSIATLENLDALGLSEAVIKLYGSATAADEGGNIYPIGGETEFAKVTLKPTDPGNTRVEDEHGKLISITAEYVFTKYTDEDGVEHNLPYMWVGTLPMWYSLKENKINGYEQGNGTVGSTSTEVVINGHVTFNPEDFRKDDEENKTYFNTETTVSAITNTYNGGLTEVSFVKKWSDEYADNDKYRPHTIALLLRRDSATNDTTDLYNGGTYTETLKNFVLLTLENNPASASWGNGGHVENLLKYDPMGNAYTYYVYGEAFYDDAPTFTEDGALILPDESNVTYIDDEGENRRVGQYYTLTANTNTTLTNTFHEDMRVTASARKLWAVGEEPLNDIEYERFDRLRTMGVLPRSINYVLMRRDKDEIGADTWEVIPALQVGYVANDAAHVTTYGGESVLGRNVNLASATQANFKSLFNSIMSWEHLPKYDTDETTPAEYVYAVAEQVTWQDGTTSALLTCDIIPQKDRNMEAAIELTVQPDTEGKETNFHTDLTNDLGSSKIRLAKLWIDNEGKDNTRPSYIELSIRPKDGGEDDTITVRLSANEEDAETDADTAYYGDQLYYSTVDIEVPFVEDDFHEVLSFGESGTDKAFIISEELVYIDEREQYETTYVQTIDSSVSGAITLDAVTGIYYLRVSNTYTPDPQDKVIDLVAEKRWNEDKITAANWSVITRPEISFRLQYKDRDSGEWVSFTDTTIQDFTLSADETAIKTVTLTGTKFTATWPQMRKYWNEPGQDGVAELIEYRITELANSTYSLIGYTADDWSGSEFDVSADESDTTADAFIKNVLNRGTINLKKEWKAGDAVLTSAVKQLVALDALPYRLNFQLQYKTGEGNWANVPFTSTSITGGVYQNKITNGSFSVETVTFANVSSHTISLNGLNLPKYDMHGNLISYRVRETSMQYQNPANPVLVVNNKAGAIEVAIDTDGKTFNNVSSVQFTVSNSYPAGSVTVEKLWNDSNDRNGLRPAKVTMKLWRDGVTSPDFNSSVKGDGATDNRAAAAHYHLPIYKNGSNVEKSKYSFEEASVPSGYTATYSAAGVADTASYQDVKIEVGRTVTVKNTHYEDTPLNAQKIWVDASDHYKQRPDSVELTLQYLNGSTWTDVETVTAIPSSEYRNGTLTPDADNGEGVFTTSANPQTLNADEGNTWGDGATPSLVWDNLPTHMLVNGSSTPVKYRVYDDVTGYTYTHSVVTATAPTTLRATNTAAAKVTVEKLWMGDDAYKHLTRPDFVKVSLESRLKTDTEGSYTMVQNSEKVLNAANNWKETWENLSDAYDYRVKEVSAAYGQTVVYANGGTESGTIGAYAYTSSVTSSTDATTKITTTKGTLTNTLATADLRVDKSWLAEDNRDAKASVTIQLKKDGEFLTDANGNTKQWNLTVSNGWTMTIQDLPVYRNDAAAHTADTKCVYEVVEVEQAGVSVSVSPATLTLDEAATAVATVTVTNNYTPARADLTVTKAWENDNNDAFASRADTLYFKLLYQANDGTWTPVPTGTIGTDGLYTVGGAALSGHAAATTSATARSDGWYEIVRTENWSYTWENLPLNILNAEGTSVKTLYTVQEGKRNADNTITALNAGDALNGYTVSYSASTTLEGEPTAEITNTLTKKPLKLSKQWDPAAVADLVQPISVTFTLEYRLGADGTWATLPSSVSVANITDSTITLTAGDGWAKQTGALPIQDANGTSYEYRISEKSITYRINGTEVTVPASGTFTGSTWNGCAGCYAGEITEASDDNAFVFTAINTAETADLRVDKSWLAEDNRDAKASVTIQLKKDGEFLTDVNGNTKQWNLTVSNGWTMTIQDLPVYRNDAAAHTADTKCVYEVVEVEQAGVSVSVSPATLTLDEAATAVATVTVTNNYTPARADLTVTKAWENDNNDAFASRADTLYFKLLYQANDGTWTPVPTGTIGTDGLYTVGGAALSGHAAATTSATARSDGWYEIVRTENWSYTWENLPLNILNTEGTSVKTLYTVQEGKRNADNTITALDAGDALNGYTVSYSASTTLEGEPTAEITNTLTKKPLKLSKQWEIPAATADLVQPISVTFTLEYRLGADGTWATLPSSVSVANITDSTITLTAGDGWAKQTGALPVQDANGTSYEYRISEKSITYSVNGTEVTVPASGAFTGSTWNGYAGCYTAEITEASDDNAFVFTAINTAETGKLIIQKSWHNGSDRDSDRGEVKVQLLRDGTVYIEEITIAVPADPTVNNWTVEIDDLPVYKDDSSGGKSVYTLHEIGETDGSIVINEHSYVVSYSEGVNVTEEEPTADETVTVINKRVLDVFDVKVTKQWIDDDNRYGLRSTFAELKLQYRAGDTGDNWQDVIHVPSVPTPEEDDGTTVFTTSAVVQIVTGDADETTWGPLVWENVPHNVKVGNESVTVYYRVVETEASITETGYTSTPSNPVCYDDAQAGTADIGNPVADSGSVVNELTETLALSVDKVWDGAGTYEAWPDKVLVTLQVSTNGGSSWTDVDSCINVELTEANGWHYDFTELRKDPNYRYRVIETAIVYLADAEAGTPEETFSTVFSSADLSSGRVGSYDMNTELAFYSDDGCYIATITNVYNPVKVHVAIPVTKIVTGDDRIPSEKHRFSFVLKGDNGTNLKTTVTDSGNATFGTLTFDRPGTYRYTVSEVKDRVETYTYDTHEYKVEIIVTDTNGVLSLRWTCEGTTEMTPTFTNTYEVPGIIERMAAGFPLNEGYCFD